jgi:hypothetical protein
MDGGRIQKPEAKLGAHLVMAGLMTIVRNGARFSVLHTLTLPRFTLRRVDRSRSTLLRCSSQLRYLSRSKRPRQAPGRQRTILHRSLMHSMRSIRQLPALEAVL